MLITMLHVLKSCALSGNLNPKHGYTNPNPKRMLAHVRIPRFEIMKHLQSPRKQYSTWPNGHGVHNEQENYHLSIINLISPPQTNNVITMWSNLKYP